MKLLQYLKNTKVQLILGLMLVVVAVLIVKLSTPKILPEVTSTYPSSDQRNVLDNSIVVINFSESLASKAKDSIVIDISPEIAGISSWQNDQSLLISPQAPLKSNTQYLVTVSAYNQEIHSFSFNSNAYSTIELRQQVKQQVIDDLNFAKVEAEMYKSMPWLRQLPIETESFRIIYDFDKEAFRIRILKTKASEDQKRTLINNALEEKNVNFILEEGFQTNFLYF